MDTIRKEFIEAQEVLASFIAKDENLLAIEKAGVLMVESFKNKGKLISCGNGGSMCDAMHIAEELSGRFRGDRPSLPAMSISDPSYMSCVINDYGADAVFSRYVEGMGFEGDILVAISTSGNSANVINAAKVAKEKGLKVVALTGKDGGKINAMDCITLKVPSNNVARIQEMHILIGHIISKYIEENC